MPDQVGTRGVNSSIIIPSTSNGTKQRTRSILDRIPPNRRRDPNESQRAYEPLLTFSSCLSVNGNLLGASTSNVAKTSLPLKSYGGSMGGMNASTTAGSNNRPPSPSCQASSRHHRPRRDEARLERQCHSPTLICPTADTPLPQRRQHPLSLTTTPTPGTNHSPPFARSSRRVRVRHMYVPRRITAAAVSIQQGVPARVSGVQQVSVLVLALSVSFNAAGLGWWAAAWAAGVKSTLFGRHCGAAKSDFAQRYESLSSEVSWSSASETRKMCAPGRSGRMASFQI